MLADLPSEIIYHIATFLPTASSLTHLAQTCRRLHQIVTADGRIFRAFVQRRFFPSVEGIPQYWKDVAQALTSRSRALDRCAIVARFMVPSDDTKVVGVDQPTRHDRPTIGYRPCLDSYEVWTGGRWEDREEVLAWGAAEKILLRIRSTGNAAGEKWLRYNDLEDVSSHDDIRGVHLLRQNHPGKTAGNEHIIYGRARGDVSHVAINPEDATYTIQQTFVTTNRAEVHSLDLSPGPEPILAVHNSSHSISLYRTATENSKVSQFAALKGETEEGTPRHYSKFLSPTRLAVGYGQKTDTIMISDIMRDHISTCREFIFWDDPFESRLWPQRKARVGAIAPLGVDMNGGNAYGEVFLAGWGNSRVRLHDIRSPRMYEQEYTDLMDSNPIYCIQPINNRFLVGAGAEAIVNIFDLRMQNAYSHFDAKPSSENNHQATNPIGGEFSCFLSHQPPGWKTRHTLYRGPIYTMSSPSSTSSTIYTGVLNGVMRLNLCSTDDLLGSSSSWYQNHLDITEDDINQKSSPTRLAADRKIVGLSGYERPMPELKNASAKLRSQVPFWSISETDRIRERETGWDQRWRRVDENQSWRTRGN